MAASVRFTILRMAAMLFAARTFGQLPSARCNAIPGRLEDCSFATRSVPTQNAVSSGTILAAADFLDDAALPAQSSQANAPSKTENGLDASTIAPAPKMPAKEGFHWGPALRESFTFLAIEQAYVVHDDFKWVVSEN